MVWKKSSLISLLSLIVILSACSGTTTSEEIYNHLEKAVENEQEFGKQQNEIVELEKEEQEIYSQIIDLSMEEFDKIKELSNQALENIETRKEKIDKEKESIEASKEEFSNIEGMISDLEEEAAKEKGEELVNTMKDRYKAYDQLYKAYSDSLSLEEELYTILQEEDLEQETLTDHIDNLNENYQNVMNANEAFNELTTEYNALKKEFYDAAGLEVNYEENPKADENSNGDSSKSEETESDE
ncbi:Putative cell-wall binding lipoprotein [Lentibacillus persicus]|uniref:Putative cell-wall binding lipoprotein n=1 Tax=Lentibacillus persicus TaxID=640948 RepID=A0A1I1VKU4_9BACI|nr:YkyA family protein [Lentibacillus persicus]SFD83637.1 Putative cell-wall binding lipoprotein [Lentibacillus persicus]